jgi:hypothetical protein
MTDEETIVLKDFRPLIVTSFFGEKLCLNIALAPFPDAPRPACPTLRAWDMGQWDRHAARG